MLRLRPTGSIYLRSRRRRSRQHQTMLPLALTVADKPNYETNAKARETTFPTHWDVDRNPTYLLYSTCVQIALQSIHTICHHAQATNQKLAFRPIL